MIQYSMVLYDVLEFFGIFAIAYLVDANGSKIDRHMKLEGLAESEMEAYHQDLKNPPPPREKLRGCRVRKSSCTMYVFFIERI